MLAMADFEWQGGCIHAKEQLCKFRLNTLSIADFVRVGVLVVRGWKLGKTNDPTGVSKLTALLQSGLLW